MAAKVWFITGSSRGFGREWAEAALERGDRVAATARKPTDLEALSESYGDSVLPLELDVTDSLGAREKMAVAHEYFGRLDVIVNNAGYGLFGAVEELSEQELRAQLETNLFGALWVTQAALPALRAQGSGHIVQISSIGGVCAFPNLGGYHASKWALEGLSESLAQEVSQFGVKVTIVEPGSYETDWAGSSAVHAVPLDAYQPMHDQMAARRGQSQGGDPRAAAQALLRIVDAEQPPLRVLFGAMPVQITKHAYEQRLATWREWEEVSLQAQGA